MPKKEDSKKRVRGVGAKAPESAGEALFHSPGGRLLAILPEREHLRQLQRGVLGGALQWQARLRRSRSQVHCAPRLSRQIAISSEVRRGLCPKNA